MADFDDDAVRDAITEVARAAFTAVRDDNPDEQFYFYGLYNVWDVDSGARLATVRGRHEALSGCAWVDDARVALCGRDVDEGPAIYVFDV
jgi:hypothetical protein